jgi:DNA-binding LytR/AlgR family response regulator
MESLPAMEEIQCMIAEDDTGAQEKLKFYISKVPFLKLKKCYTNAHEAFAYLKSHPVDLLFLDLVMEEFSGMELLESLDHRPYVIITTGFERFAMKAYELNVQDYLLKPFTFERFVKAVNRIFDLIHKDEPLYEALEEQTGNHRTQEYFFVRNNYKMLRVSCSEIDYIQGLSNYLIIKTKSGQVFTLQGFSDILRLLPPDRFVRIHRSYVVAIDKIEFIQKNKVKIGDRMIPIGESYKQMFMNHLKAHHMM